MRHAIAARTTMFIQAEPARVYTAFVEPECLTAFWLAKASSPLRLGSAVRWDFLVEGAYVDTTATLMEVGHRLAWDWSDGSKVSVSFDALDGGVAVTLVNDDFPHTGDALIDAALNATEGFALVLADLKTWIESGASAGITRAKARLIMRPQESCRS